MQDARPPSPRRTRWLPVVLGRLLLVAVMGLALLAGLVWARVVVLPGRFDPFAPLVVAEPPNWLTRIKLSRLREDGPQCLAVLDEAPVTFTPVADRETGEGCGFQNAVEVTRSTVAFSRSFTATCPLTVAWSLFEAHVLQQAARRHLGREVAQVRHFGTYACRNVNHRPEGRRSQHATANAIDVAGFILDDGSEISLAGDWDGPDPRRRAFLRALRDGACRFFNVVLSPDFNEAHRDHFHLDMGTFRTCR